MEFKSHPNHVRHLGLEHNMLDEFLGNNALVSSKRSEDQQRKKKKDEPVATPAPVRVSQRRRSSTNSANQPPKKNQEYRGRDPRRRNVGKSEPPPPPRAAVGMKRRSSRSSEEIAEGSDCKKSKSKIVGDVFECNVCEEHYIANSPAAKIDHLAVHFWVAIKDQKEEKICTFCNKKVSFT